MVKEIDLYRDGGTISIRCTIPFPFVEKYGLTKNVVEICIDHRMHSTTKGKWFLGYPEMGVDIDKDAELKGLLTKRLREYQTHINSLVEKAVPLPI